MRRLPVLLLVACGGSPQPARRPITRMPAPAIHVPAPEKVAEPPKTAPPIDRRYADEEPRGEGQLGTDSTDFAERPAGDPFLTKLATDVAAVWTPGSLAISDPPPAGCLRLTADGRVAETKLAAPTGNADLDAAVERTLTTVAAQRNARPEPVPPHLQKVLSKMVCFRLSVKP